MTTRWESFKADGDQLVEKVKRLIHEGNIRSVSVHHDGRVIATFPLTAGVLGAVIAPVLAAIGALVALLEDCTITIEREDSSGKSTKGSHAA